MFTDDGKGIDVQTIRALAVDKGLMRADSKVTDEELVMRIIEFGFSTNENTTDLSGRGIGMNAVKKAVKELGGNILIMSKAGEGTCVRISLPYILPKFYENIEEI